MFLILVLESLLSEERIEICLFCLFKPNNKKIYNVKLFCTSINMKRCRFFRKIIRNYIKVLINFNANFVTQWIHNKQDKIKF